ncbi:hypothetical protein DSM106972_077040 [Dulcicalothrix desertica PCC 7102]|uniref:Uncharacterized protein n=1 Tax=Dulcicalothrix desertica PCC 7102 TaxID=232991 RepID=A0A3S1AWF8_9CYAN|nr:hypothetical protein DSM106972_077040 [Dulcicalothrix desertica PCC 7102]
MSVIEIAGSKPCTINITTQAKVQKPDADQTSFRVFVKCEKIVFKLFNLLFKISNPTNHK